MSLLPLQVSGSVATAIAIIVGAFVSEDAATITAATLAAGSVLDPRLSFFSAATGLWAGDLGVYAVARIWGEKARRTSWLGRAASSAEQATAGTAGGWALALSRFFPGARLPAYVAAGLNRMPFPRYAGITALTASIWTSIVFTAIWLFPGQAQTARERLAQVGMAGLTIFGIVFLWKRFGHHLQFSLRNLWQRVTRWEFWPPWLFYTPVALMCAWLSARFRGISLPTVANLNQKNGGIIGESKYEILRELMESSPEATAAAYLIPAGGDEVRFGRIQDLLARHEISFPFVLKPDTAQRGAGFRKIRSLGEVQEYLQRISQSLVLQRYVQGPQEAGIFYYRFPGQLEGQIFGITRKRFPVLAGDGIHSLKQLVELDDRARFLRGVYLKRLGAEAKRVPAAGELVRLVEAGNHCQGCIFEDGWDLDSEELRRAMDRISLPLNGFYVGRFDVRYTDDDSLRAGKGFQVIELNGAASEATNLYDAKNSLWAAYRTLYRQWRLIYAIGAENRKRGAVPRAALSVWRDWREFSSHACEFPIAD